MAFWRRWNRASRTQQQKKHSESQLDWEFGGDEPVVVRDGVSSATTRQGIPHGAQAAQRHAHGRHRRAIERPQAVPPVPPAEPVFSIHRSTEDVNLFRPEANEQAHPVEPPIIESIPHEQIDDAWEEGATVDLRDAFRGIEAAPRVRTVRQALELALDDWWSQQKLLSPALLRNGLLVLEAGNPLDEPHRSLLLRSALWLRRGMLTALRHQTDPDRAAYLLKEALLLESDPLPLSTLWWLRQEDENSQEWVELLQYDLEQDIRDAAGERRKLVEAALRQLQSDELLVEPEPAPLPPRWPMIRVIPPVWSVGRALIVVLLVVLLLGTVAWNRQRSQFNDVVFVPAGVYTISNPTDETNIAEVSVELGAFAIDRTEVTNRDYRLCYEQGHCPPPQDIDSATRQGYFFDPAFDFYPVVNIDWESARAYCAWAGKRLPTLSEWEVAASIAPATQRRYLYPWGDFFQRQYANNALTNVGDTQRVGLYSPVGESSFGADDMAGNVAEWTVSSATVDLDENMTLRPQEQAVKGGSYQDNADGLRTDAIVWLAADSAQPWVGFRCSATISDDLQGLFLFTNR